MNKKGKGDENRQDKYKTNNKMAKYTGSYVNNVTTLKFSS